MAISSNTLFHFTNEANNLIGILSKGFYPRFCTENLLPIFPDESIIKEKYYKILQFAIPSVSFCDLPLSSINEHLDFYGNYGIGLRKEWGMKNGINPILYFAENSYLSKYLSQLMENNFLETDDDNFFLFLEVMGFFKPYKGQMYRNGKPHNKVFYNEMEWRYLPDLRKSGGSYRLSLEEYFDDIERGLANSELEEKCQLTFEPEDIKYIIVKNENEISSMIKVLESLKNIKESDNVKILISKIISSEQISTDF